MDEVSLKLLIYWLIHKKEIKVGHDSGSLRNEDIKLIRKIIDEDVEFEPTYDSKMNLL